MKEKKSEWARLAKSDTQDIDWRTWLYSLAKILLQIPWTIPLQKKKHVFEIILAFCIYVNGTGCISGFSFSSR